MKKLVAALLVLLLLAAAMPLGLVEGHPVLECGCPEGTSVYYEYPTYYMTNENSHMLLEKQLVYCEGCGKHISTGSDVDLTPWEPHDFDGYECQVCGYWRLGTASMYENTSYTELRSAAIGGIVSFGSYEQDGIDNNGKEPIEWIVLDRRGSEVLLLSRYGLDVQPYHHTSMAINWSESSVRQWLQGEFRRTAFSEDERAMLVKVCNSTPVNSNNSGSPGPDTYDSVFLLSAPEATKYLTTPESRMVKATSYALMRGAGTNYSQNSFWWLRSYADANRRVVLMINSQGNVWASYMNDYEAVVRPAIWVNVD